MTILQRLLLEAGTAAIVVLTAYALLPVLLILINGDMTSSGASRHLPHRGRQYGKPDGGEGEEE